MLRSVHTTKSHAAINWQPAAAANPSTFAITGTGDSLISNINSVAVWKTRRWNSWPVSFVNSLRLWPALNTVGPLADNTMHRKSSFCLFRLICVINSVIISSDRAFLRKSKHFRILSMICVWVFTLFLDCLAEYYGYRHFLLLASAASKPHHKRTIVPAPTTAAIKSTNKIHFRWQVP